jgi:hypothetical protein
MTLQTVKLTPTVGHCRDVLIFGRRHLVAATNAGEDHELVWVELAAIRKALAGKRRDEAVDRAMWQRCRRVGNATGRQAPKAWWNARRWGGTRPD